jgi:hypothetical protein
MRLSVSPHNNFQNVCAGPAVEEVGCARILAGYPFSIFFFIILRGWYNVWCGGGQQAPSPIVFSLLNLSGRFKVSSSCTQYQ